MKVISLSLCFAIGWTGGDFALAQNWRQAAGPQGDWNSRTETKVPASFNVASGENVLWTMAMEESGQSGIVVWEDRLFLTILNPYEADGEMGKKTTPSIRALCLDASSGETIWNYDLVPGRYVLREDFDLTQLPKSNIFPAWYTNYLVGEHLYFMCFNDDVKAPLMRRWRDLLSRHCFARVNLVTAKELICVGSQGRTIPSN